MSTSLSQSSHIRTRDRFLHPFSSKRKAVPATSKSKVPLQAQSYNAQTIVPPIVPPPTRPPNPSPNSPPRLSAKPVAPRQAITSPSNTSNPALKQAIQRQNDKLPPTERDAFLRASTSIDQNNLLSKIRAIDKEHKNNSSIRSHADSLNNTLGLLSRLFGAVANVTQINTYASVVVGGVKLIVDMALNFVKFFDKLTEMLDQLSGYLGAFDEYGKSCDSSTLCSALSDAYSDMLDFCQAARRVFLDDNGTPRKHANTNLFLQSHWKPFEDTFGAISSSLKQHCDVLLHVAQGRQLSILSGGEQREKAKEQRDFMRWLSERTHNFHQKHQDVLGKRHQGTGDWLLASPEFSKWSTSRSSKLLWCHGQPGAGKSVLAANAIENLLQRYAVRKDVGVCYAYYSFNNQSFRGQNTLVAALLQQLCLQMDSVPRELLNMRDLSLISQTHLYKLFAAYKEVFIVIDGLDECPPEGKETVLEFLDQAANHKRSCIKVLVSSRREDDIVRYLKSPENIILPIGPQRIHQDITRFVREETERLRKSKKGLRLAVKSDTLFEEVVKILIQKSGGMFLWVTIQLRTLCEESEAGDAKVRKALSRLPDGLTNTYVRVLNDIGRKSPSKREIAFNCFRWVLYAKRPLTWGELTYALPLSESEPPSNLKEIGVQARDYRFAMIVGACGNLLTSGGHDDFVAPIHFSVVQFFQSTLPQIKLEGTPWNKLTDQRAMHSRLSQDCLQFICFTIEWCPLGRAVTCERASQLGYNTFTRYAVHFFDQHALESSSETASPDPALLGRINGILSQTEEYLAKLLEMRLALKPVAYDWEEEANISRPVSASSILWATQLCNIPAVACNWMQSIKCGRSDHVLHYAAKSGIIGSVKNLVAEGYNVNEMDAEGRTPLYYACENGHDPVVELLLRKHASQSVGNDTPLRIAAREGHLSVVKRLVQNGADVNKPGRRSESNVLPLHTALRFGHDEIVELLARHGANPNISDDLGFNALHLAAAWASSRSVKTILGAGANVKAIDPSSGETALHYAIADRDDELRRQSSLEICRILCAKDSANCRVFDRCGSTALHYAAQESSVEVVTYLISRGSNVTAIDGAGRTIFDIAACNRFDTGVLKYLLDNLAFIEPRKNSFGALHWSCRSDSAENTQLLLDRGFKASVLNTTRTGQRWTPYNIGVYHGNIQVFAADHAIPLKTLGQGLLPEPGWRDMNAFRRPFVCDTCHLRTTWGPYFKCTDCNHQQTKICIMCTNNPGSLHYNHKLEIFYNVWFGTNEETFEAGKIYDEDSVGWRKWVEEKRKEKARSKYDWAANPGAEDCDSDMWYSDS